MTGAARFTAPPSVEVRVYLEDLPQVRYFAATGEDAERLRLWIERRPDLYALIASAADYTDGVIEGPPGAPDWTLHRSAV